VFPIVDVHSPSPGTPGGVVVGDDSVNIISELGVVEAIAHDDIRVAVVQIKTANGRGSPAGGVAGQDGVVFVRCF
jgi:hypothetical protein